MILDKDIQIGDLLIDKHYIGYVLNVRTLPNGAQFDTLFTIKWIVDPVYATGSTETYFSTETHWNMIKQKFTRIPKCPKVR